MWFKIANCTACCMLQLSKNLLCILPLWVFVLCSILNLQNVQHFTAINLHLHCLWYCQYNCFYCYYNYYLYYNKFNNYSTGSPSYYCGYFMLYMLIYACNTCCSLQYILNTHGYEHRTILVLVMNTAYTKNQLWTPTRLWTQNVYSVWFLVLYIHLFPPSSKTWNKFTLQLNIELRT